MAMNSFDLHKITVDELIELTIWENQTKDTRRLVNWYHHGPDRNRIEFSVTVLCTDELDMTEIKLKWGYRS